MKYVVFLYLLSGFSFNVQAQLSTTDPDKSPLDVAYHPAGYPILKFQSKTPPAKPLARVLYSRPQKAGREVFGDVVKYNEVWRLGANESTELEFFKDVTIANRKLPKGRYSVFCIPNTKSWTLILNKDLDSWGAFSYAVKNDVLRTSLPVSDTEKVAEYFTMYFDQAGALHILWDRKEAVLPIRY